MSSTIRLEGEDLAVRPLRAGDKPALLALSSRIWEGDDYLPAVFDAWIDTPGAPFLGLFLREKLVGCTRMFPLDARRAWLEGLRVDPEFQGRGLGRALSRFNFALGRDLGFQELLFSTYFRNARSIRVAEEAGFERVARFTFLFHKLSEAAAETGSYPAQDSSIPVAWEEVLPPHFRSSDPGEWRSNDWLFLPADLPDLPRHFPNARTVRAGSSRLVAAANRKDPRSGLDIAVTIAGTDRELRACLGALLRTAGSEASKVQHMLPAGRPLGPWLECGFRFEEQPEDVHLFRGRASELRLDGA